MTHFAPDYFNASATAPSYLLVLHAQTGDVCVVRFQGECTITGVCDSAARDMRPGQLPLLRYDASTSACLTYAQQDAAGLWLALGEIVTPEAWG